MLMSLWLPIIVSTIALFFASFLSWMVVPLHKKDWLKLEREDDFLKAARDLGLTVGSYMFPGCNSPQDMKSDDFKKKWESGPRGIITIFSEMGMGPKLGLTLLYFLAVNFCLAYLATLAVDPGANFMTVFRFVTTAGVMTFLAAIL